MNIILTIFLIGFIILLFWFWIVSRTGLPGNDQGSEPPPDDDS